MSKYTTQIRWIIEQEESTQKTPLPDGQLYHDATYKKLGLDSFPIFDESYRHTLTDKIINHYYMREIGFETVALFAWYMRQTMWEIMPYYNKLYEAIEMVTDPLVDYKRDYNEDWNVKNDDVEKQNYDNTRNTLTNSKGNTKSNDENIYQDTPMSMLDNPAPNPVENKKFATNVTYDNGNTDSTSSSDSKNTLTGEDTLTKDKNEDGLRNKHVTGINKSQAYLLDEYAKKMLNIDMMIINKLQDLFFALW